MKGYRPLLNCPGQPDPSACGCCWRSHSVMAPSGHHHWWQQHHGCAASAREQLCSAVGASTGHMKNFTSKFLVTDLIRYQLTKCSHSVAIQCLTQLYTIHHCFQCSYRGQTEHLKPLCSWAVSAKAQDIEKMQLPFSFTELMLNFCCFSLCSMNRVRSVHISPSNL